MPRNLDGGRLFCGSECSFLFSGPASTSGPGQCASVGIIGTVAHTNYHALRRGVETRRCGCAVSVRKIFFSQNERKLRGKGEVPTRTMRVGEKMIGRPESFGGSCKRPPRQLPAGPSPDAGCIHRTA